MPSNTGLLSCPRITNRLTEGKSAEEDTDDEATDETDDAEETEEARADYDSPEQGEEKSQKESS